jgi:hypothetical protein
LAIDPYHFEGGGFLLHIEAAGRNMYGWDVGKNTKTSISTLLVN